MLVVRYTGGIGNQLFQYALQIVLSYLYPETTVKADISFYRLLDEHQGFTVDKWFQADIEKADTHEINQFCCALAVKPWVRLLPANIRRYIAFHAGRFMQIKEKTAKPHRKGHVISVNEPYIFQELLFHLNTNQSWYICGLWQNWQYFAGYEKLLKKAMRFKLSYGEQEKRIKKKIKESRCAVSIHIRRGDFVKSSLDICNKKYYEKAMQYIRSKKEDITWFVFSDDVKSVQRLFPNQKCIFASGGERYAIYDMMLMSECDCNIISNSTFSFWAAFLNENSEKIVVCPKYVNITYQGKYPLKAPEGWVKIDLLDNDDGN